MTFARPLKSFLLVFAFGALVPLGLAQDNSNWTSSSDRQDPNGNLNPVRTRETHTESNGRIIDRKSIETLGPDGRYVPYLETESETVRVDASTVRTIERTYGHAPDGSRALVQQTQQESRTLAGGETSTVRTTSNPDANGTLQVIQRETQHSRQISPALTDTKTTILTPDLNGGLRPVMQIDERQKKNGDGTIDFRKSTSLPDGAGNWQIGEVREGTRRQDSSSQNPLSRNLEERVLRPDANGNLATVERTVTRQTENRPGEQRETRETYSTYVPGAAGNDGLQLVQRDTTLYRSTAAGERTTTRQVEQTTPGAGLRVTGQSVDLVRPGSGGVADQRQTVVSFDSDGNASTVWVDVGKTNNPAVVHVDTAPSSKPK